MNKQAIAIAALLAATAAHAESQPQVYVTVAGGATHVAVECTGATTCDASDTGGKLVAGYDFGNGFSLEGGYISFGKARAADAISSATIKPSAFVLGGAYALPLGADWGLNVRLGVAQVKTKGEAVRGAVRLSTSESKANVYVGVGATYALSKTIKLELGLDSTQGHIDGEKGTVSLVSLGATFAF